MRHAIPRTGRHSRTSPPESPMSPRTEHNRLNARRRFAAAVLAIVGVAGLGIASAAQLNLSGSPISAGSTLIATCQTSGTPITVEFPITWAAPSYRVSSVKLSNVHTDCNGKKFQLQLLNVGGTAALGTEVTAGILSVVGGVATVTVGTQLAYDVGGVALVITG